MTDSKKIIDNPTFSEFRKQLEAFNAFESLYATSPLVQRLFPNAQDTFDKLRKIKEQADILRLPDAFNERFGKLGWIAYESMNLEVMRLAIECFDTNGSDAAERFLAESYDDATVRWGIQRFQGNGNFRKRIRLAELARIDYLAGRYHACVPLLLSLLDGVVNDVSRHVGFFAGPADLTAWDCIAAHGTGLKLLASLFSESRSKTNEEEISVPYRNGILHGRELAFDNRLVAAKCWGALFAVRDWASALEKRKKNEPKQEKGWGEILQQIAATSRFNRAVSEWKPRSAAEFPYLPCEGVGGIPDDTPEFAVSAFLDDWSKSRFGPVAEALAYAGDAPSGKRAGMARRDFGRNVPVSFTVLAVEDRSAAISYVEAELRFERGGRLESEKVVVQAVCQDMKGDLSIRSIPGGRWKIVQNSLRAIIYGHGSRKRMDNAP